jgi:hypothetical protein
MRPENQWFFSDCSFTPESILHQNPDTWKYEEFVIIYKDEIIAFFSAKWSRPLDIIIDLRILIFNQNSSYLATKGLFDFFDYLFCSRGCNAINWLVAEKNVHAYKLYNKFIKNYFGHKVGIRNYGQKSYTGEISKVILYEITKDEYLAWKKK